MDKKTNTVLITGASGGIGGEIARKFGRLGYNIVINYCRSEKEAYALAKELAPYCQCIAIKADITNFDDIKNMRERVEKVFGGVDILVNNAGVSQIDLLTNLNECDISRLIDVNLRGAILVTHEFIPYMVSQKWGKVINISSMWGASGASCETVYSAAKSGLIGFTKGLAKELGPSNINVNCVAPGLIDTPMNGSLGNSIVCSLVDDTPLCRMGTTADIANMVYFLSKNDSSFITGQTFLVDGGFSL